MPRSTTAWLMASVSVACSAMRPSQIKIRLNALNISIPPLLFVVFLEKHFLLEHKIQLLIQLLLVGGSDDGRAVLLERCKNTRADIESNKVSEQNGALAFGFIHEARQHLCGRWPDSVLAIGNDQDVLLGHAG